MPGEPIQAVIGTQTASARLAGLTGFLVFLSLNEYRIIAVTPSRIVVLDAGKTSIKKARGMVTKLPRSTRLGPGSGVCSWTRSSMSWACTPTPPEKAVVLCVDEK
jgi:hypothetical protein